jgi:hypothetical protein
MLKERTLGIFKIMVFSTNTKYTRGFCSKQIKLDGKHSARIHVGSDQEAGG